jgi:chemotaxis protein MotA
MIDIATALGLIIGFAVTVLLMVMSGDLSLFINGHAALVIFGGALAATLIRFPLSTMLNGLPMGLRYVFQMRASDPRIVIESIAELATKARREGVLSLKSEAISDVFLAKGVQYLVDGHDAATLRLQLERERDSHLNRLDQGQKIYRSIGECAPAFGMIGTLIGMVQMFANMADPTSLGPYMATALLATLYGALIANIIALPIADKLEGKLHDEELTRTIIIEGVVAMREAKNPRLLREGLLSFLPEHHKHEAFA